MIKMTMTIWFEDLPDYNMFKEYLDEFDMDYEVEEIVAEMRKRKE